MVRMIAFEFLAILFVGVGLSLLLLGVGRFQGIIDRLMKGKKDAE